MGAGIAIVIGIAVFVALNSAWRRTISRTPVDPASPGDLEELAGNIGGIVIFLLVAAATLVAAWLLR